MGLSIFVKEWQSLITILNKIRRKLPDKGTLIILVILLSLGCLSVTWFRGNYFLVSMDSIFPLNPTRTLSSFYYIWDSTAPPGVAVGRHFTLTFYETILAFCQMIGLSLVSAQKTEFYLSLAFSGISMYYLTVTVYSPEKKKLASLVSSLFYMLNPFTMLWVWHDHLTDMFLYALLPLILALYIRGLKEKKSVLYAFLICLFSFLATPAFANPVEAIVLWLVLFSFGIFYALMKWRSRSEITFAVKFTCIAFLVWFAFNMFWILPTIYSLPGEVGVLEAIRAGSSNFEKLVVNSLDSTMINSFRLLGYWTFSQKYGGGSFYPYAPLYYSPFFEITSFLIPILAFIPFLRRGGDKENNLIFFGALALLGLLGMTALQPPAGALYMWLFSHVPVFQIFRDPYYRFGFITTLGYAFLIGNGTNCVFRAAKRIPRKIPVDKIVIAILCFLLLAVYVWPIWTGDVLASGSQWTPSAHVKVPDYYSDADKWLSTQADDFRLFTLPLSTVYFAAYKWQNGYMGPDPSPWLFSKPTINRDTGSSYDLATLIAQTISQDPSSDSIAKRLTLLNVKYVVLHKDADYDYMSFNPSWFVFAPTDSLIKGLASDSDLRLEQTFGQLEFYQNLLYAPLSAYSASDAILINGNLDDLTEFVREWNFDMDKTAFFLTEQQDPESLSTVPFNAVVFQNRDLYDLALMMTEKKYVISLPEGGAISFPENTSKVNFSMRIDSEDTYEAWMRLSSDSANSVWTLQVDDKTTLEDVNVLANNLLKSCWVDLGAISLGEGHHLLTLLNKEGEQLPTEIILAPSSEVDTALTTLQKSVERQYQEVVFGVQSLAQVNVKSYLGWKGVISTTGVGEPDMLVFPSLNETPFTFPPGKLCQGNLRALNSTLIYITTGSNALRIDQILTDGMPAEDPAYPPISLFWETGCAGNGTTPLQFPVTIPPNEKAIILIDNHIAQSVEVQTSEGSTLLRVDDGWAIPFQFWTFAMMQSGNIFIPSGVYRFLTNLEDGVNGIELNVQIDGRNVTLNQTVKGVSSSYQLSSPIFLESGVHSLSIPTELKKLSFFSASSGIPQNDVDNVFRSDENLTTEFNVEEINPTMYSLHLNSQKPCFLVLSESYDSSWKLYLGQQNWISALGTQPVGEDQHLVANGYANSWYVPAGKFSLTVYFQAQSLFYSGVIVSSITLVTTIGYLMYKHNRMKRRISSSGKVITQNRDNLTPSETWMKSSIACVAVFCGLLISAAVTLVLGNTTLTEIMGIIALFCLASGILARLLSLLSAK